MSEQKLTRRIQVLAEVSRGAKIERPDHAHGLLRLVKDGREIDAWQTALQSAARALGLSP